MVPENNSPSTRVPRPIKMMFITDKTETVLEVEDSQAKSEITAYGQSTSSCPLPSVARLLSNAAAKSKANGTLGWVHRVVFRAPSSVK